MAPTSVISGIPVNSLYPDRYQIGKSKLYEILKQLKITPYRDGKTACITLEQLHQLDRYMAGEGVETFTETSTELSGETSTGATSPQLQAIVPVEMSTLPPALQLIVDAIAARMSATPVDPLLPQRQLQELCDRGWLASTSQLIKILGVRPRTDMVRYGFRFEPMGKMGREGSWQVKSTINPDIAVIGH